MKNSGIYRIESKVKPERVYIGSAVHLSKRWTTHLWGLKNDRHHSTKLQNHFNKYGESDLVFIIVEHCLPDFLITREQYYIDSLNPYFNECKIAGNCLGKKWSEEMYRKKIGRKHSEESRKKMSKSLIGNKRTLGYKHSEESKRKMGDSHKGLIKSIETCNKLSKSLMGHTVSVESRKKISEGHKGKRASDETRQKMSELRKGIKYNLGRIASIETRKKMSTAHMGNKSHLGLKMSDEAKRKMIATNTGSKRTEETKNKMKAAWVLRKNKVA
jgi:group I intron endonuclease